MTEEARAEELLALAARCEAAMGADRESDQAIYEARFPAERRDWIKDEPGAYWITGGSKTVPAYTASLDAAMMLVPHHDGEPWLWAVDGGGSGPAVARVFWDCVEGSGEIKAATPALALTAAALRARAGQS